MKTIYAKMTTRGERGFTLIELLVVIAIIAILAALVLAALTSAQKGGRDSKRRSDINQIKVAAVQYQSDNNTYPVSATGQNLVSGNGSISPAFIGTTNYMSQAPTAPGGDTEQNRYWYFGDSSSFCVSSESERKTGTYLGASKTGQFNDKTADCTAPNSFD